MKKHQGAAMLVGAIPSLFSFLPVFITMNKGYNLAHPKIVGVFVSPTIGVAVVAVIIFIAFLKNEKE